MLTLGLRRYGSSTRYGTTTTYDRTTTKRIGRIINNYSYFICELATRHRVSPSLLFVLLSVGPFTYEDHNHLVALSC
jgi:hypothetical protein